MLTAGVVALAGALGSSPWETPLRDRLGPTGDEGAAEYVARAAASLQQGGQGERWALVSLRERAQPSALPTLAAGVRVARVLYHPLVERVQTPLRAQPVAGDDASLRSSGSYVASQLWAELDRQDPASRAAQVTRLSAVRLAGGCACVVAVVVLAEAEALRALAGRAQVRAVQALPHGVAPLGVRPLLPEQTDLAGPTPDDGPVPPA